MEPVNSAYKLEIEHGLWGVVDAISHVEAAIAQHPDASRRDELKRELMRLETEHSKPFISFLAGIECELDGLELLEK